jgi:ABC-2 type transport system ATP-binding protein
VAVVEIAGLRKTYRRVFRGPQRAVDGLDMLVEPGQVHGFLGPNGSGKTTTLRALLGLVRANAGEMRLLGEPVPWALPRIAPRVGAIVESPQFFGNFSGRRTLRLLATAGGVPRSRVEEVLELVGLRDRAKDRVKAYSLGMRQRLAVASALLKSPELLILDEPANGLDPAGIREMRDLMRGLVATGTTVVLSSHILGEVQQICDSVTIVSRGQRVAHGPVAQVLASQDKGEYRVRVREHNRAAAILAQAGAPIRVYDDYFVVSDLAEPAWITETLAAHQMWVSELTPLVPDLESVFLQLTGTASEPAATSPSAVGS